MNVQLREYQKQGIDEIFESWRTCNSVLFQMPTGTGKTTLFCEIARLFITEINKDKKVLIVTHRKELVEQVFERLVSGYHLTTGIISANYIGIQSAPIQVASIQTLVRREEHQNDIFSLVIIDEAHHALANTYKQLWEFYPSSKFLGVTATPIRTNGQGFQDLFEKLIISNQIKWFIENKYLSNIRYYASHTPDLSNVRIIAGDYDETELGEVMQSNDIMADLVQSYKDFAEGKKVIIFAVNRTHCDKIVEKFNNSGYIARSIDTYTTSEERRKIIEEFRQSKFNILCNVNIFTEGFDCPDVDAVQLARPTKSLTLFLQQVGRCMRPHYNKLFGIILDNAGLWKEHGLPKMERRWDLKGSKEKIAIDKNSIVGIINDIFSKERNIIPKESNAIRLVEMDELKDIEYSKTIEYNLIEKKLIDKNHNTMNERINEITKAINRYNELIENEVISDVKKNLEKSKKELEIELGKLQLNFKPQRFDQVLELIKKQCHEIIDTNDIFIEEDKDDFLKIFNEPSLSTTISRQSSIEDYSIIKREPNKTIFSPDEIEIFHYFHHQNIKATAKFNKSTGKVTYKGKSNLSPSKAAVEATFDYTNNSHELNGWVWWKYIDKNGTEKKLDYLRRK
ncbi:MAG: DEAD/DEAH box helicase [Chitinophagales bacterium]|nr:DEAD/DEAH box helicase [Chitinophagales bacterium]